MSNNDTIQDDVKEKILTVVIDPLHRLLDWLKNKPSEKDLAYALMMLLWERKKEVEHARNENAIGFTEAKNKINLLQQDEVYLAEIIRRINRGQ